MDSRLLTNTPHPAAHPVHPAHPVHTADPADNSHAQTRHSQAVHTVPVEAPETRRIDPHGPGSCHTAGPDRRVALVGADPGLGRIVGCGRSLVGLGRGIGRRGRRIGLGVGVGHFDEDCEGR